MAKKPKKSSSMVLEGGPRMGSGAPMREHVLHHLQNGEGSSGRSILRGIGAGLRDKLSGESLTRNLLGGGELAGAFAKRVFAKKVNLAPPNLAPPSAESESPQKVISPRSTEPVAKEGTQKRSTGIQGSILKQVTLTNALLKSIRRQIIAGSGGEVKTLTPGFSKSPKSVTAKGFDNKATGGGLFDSIGALLGKFSESIGGLLPTLGKFALGLAAVSAAFAGGYWLGDKLKGGIDGFITMITKGKETTLGGMVHTLLNDNTPDNKNSEAQTKFMNNAQEVGKSVQNVLPDFFNSDKRIEELNIKKKIGKGDVFSWDDIDKIKRDHPSMVIPEDNQPHGPGAPKKVNNEASGQINTVDSVAPKANAVTPAVPSVMKPVTDVEKYTVGEVPGREIMTAAQVAGLSDPAKLSALVKNESSGKLSNNTGDGGSAYGITQMHKPAIADVNKAYGTSYTPEMLAQDYKAALQAGARYFKMKDESFAKYNGGGDKNYVQKAETTIAKINGPANLAVAAAPVPVAPPSATRGDKIATASAEAKESTKVASAPPSVVNAPSTTINHNSTVNLPLPNIRNADMNAFALRRGLAVG